MVPLEGIRYGFRVYSNDLNPVSSLVQKATLEYPALHASGERSRKRSGSTHVQAHEAVRRRQLRFFPFSLRPSGGRKKRPTQRQIPGREPVPSNRPDRPHPVRFLWCRMIDCPKCGLNIPLSTNFHIVTKKGKPEASIAAFPEVPPVGQGNHCKFRIVGAPEWADCRWPRLGSDPWHPRDTPSYRDGHAECPRCGAVIHESDVKKAAQARPGGLPCQMYAVCSQVPVKLTYRNRSTAVRYLWRSGLPPRPTLTPSGPPSRNLPPMRPAGRTLSRPRGSVRRADHEAALLRPPPLAGHVPAPATAHHCHNSEEVRAASVKRD